MSTALETRPEVPAAPPRSRKARRWRAVAAAVLVLPLAAFAVTYLLFFTPDSPSRLRLSTPESTPTLLGVPAGHWSVGAGSVAGYRVREKLLSLPASNDAVGRTGAITGGFTLDVGSRGFVVEQGMRIDVDLSTLQSDQPRRDEHMHTMAIETDLFPTATFVSTAEVVVPETALVNGGPVTATVAGNLTLHGVTRPVSIPVEAQRNGDRIEVVGSFSFGWELFDMNRPNMSYVTVESDPTMELQLFFDPPRSEPGSVGGR